jgi:hypothetical protein
MFILYCDLYIYISVYGYQDTLTWPSAKKGEGRVTL